MENFKNFTGKQANDWKSRTLLEIRFSTEIHLLSMP